MAAFGDWNPLPLNWDSKEPFLAADAAMPDLGSSGHYLCSRCPLFQQKYCLCLLDDKQLGLKKRESSVKHLCWNEVSANAGSVWTSNSIEVMVIRCTYGTIKISNQCEYDHWRTVWQSPSMKPKIAIRWKEIQYTSQACSKMFNRCQLNYLPHENNVL